MNAFLDKKEVFENILHDAVMEALNERRVDKQNCQMNCKIALYPISTDEN